MIRFSNKRPKVGDWTITLAARPLLEYGSYGLGWRAYRFGVFKLKEELVEGQLVRGADYTGFILFWRAWFPFERGV